MVLVSRPTLAGIGSLRLGEKRINPVAYALTAKHDNENPKLPKIADGTVSVGRDDVNTLFAMMGGGMAELELVGGQRVDLLIVRVEGFLSAASPATATVRVNGPLPDVRLTR